MPCLVEGLEFVEAAIPRGLEVEPSTMRDGHGQVGLKPRIGFMTRSDPRQTRVVGQIVGAVKRNSVSRSLSHRCDIVLFEKFIRS